jgi:hypothetical protein
VGGCSVARQLSAAAWAHGQLSARTFERRDTWVRGRLSAGRLSANI